MELKDLITKSGYYRIKVIPQQPLTELRGVMDDDTLKIALKAVPEKGKANKELIIYLAKELGVGREDISISSGLTSRLKVVDIYLESK